MAESQQRWDTAYEWKAVTLLGLGFGRPGVRGPRLDGRESRNGRSRGSQLDLNCGRA